MYVIEDEASVVLIEGEFTLGEYLMHQQTTKQLCHVKLT
jgi:hypothetical protein